MCFKWRSILRHSTDSTVNQRKNGSLLPLNLNRERGQSLVELAIAMPIIIFLSVVFVDLGRAFSTYVDVLGASQYGARVAAVNPQMTPNEIRNAILAVEPAQGLGLVASDIIVDFPNGHLNCQPARVRVGRDFVPATPILSTLIGDTPLRLQGETIMIIQYTGC